MPVSSLGGFELVPEQCPVALLIGDRHRQASTTDLSEGRAAIGQRLQERAQPVKPIFLLGIVMVLCLGSLIASAAADENEVREFERVDPRA